MSTIHSKIWNGEKWVPDTGTGGGPTWIDDLIDVDTTTSPPNIGDTFVWDGLNWVPGSSGSVISGAGYKATFTMLDASLLVTHDLGTKDVMVTVLDMATMEEIGPNISRVSTNEVQIDFGAGYPETIRVLVLAV